MRWSWRPRSADRAGDRGLASARERFEARAARARRRPRLLLGIAVSAVVLVGAVIWIGWFSSLLPAEQVDVSGVPSAERKTVLATAAVPLGEPLMRVDTDSITARLAKDPQWSSVTVTRRLPGTVVVRVVPREPAVAVRVTGGYRLVDSEGTAFRTVKSAPKGVPVVRADPEEVTRGGVAVTVSALAALDDGLRAKVKDLRVSAADHLTFTLSVDGRTRTVVWGTAADAMTKARIVKVLLGQPGNTIDVSVPDSPVMR